MHRSQTRRTAVSTAVAAVVALVLAACTTPSPAAPTTAPTTAAPKPTTAAAPTTAPTVAAPTSAAKPTNPPAVASPAAASPTAAAAAKPTAVPNPLPAAIAGEQLVVMVDTVRGPVGLTPDQQPILTCVQQNRFPQGAHIVWRARVMDTSGGKALDDKVLKSVTLTLPDGTTQALKYGAHGPGDAFWTTSYVVPNDYPTGEFKYKIDAVDNGGRTGSSFQFNVANSLTQIVPAGQQ